MVEGSDADELGTRYRESDFTQLPECARGNDPSSQLP